MNIAIRKVGSVVIVDLDGPLTIEANTPDLQETMVTLTKHAPKHIVLNMERVRTMDCWGIGRIAVCYRTVRHDGGVLKLLKLSRRSRHLLEKAKILSIVEAYESEEEVIRSFSGASKEGSQRLGNQTVTPRPDRYWLDWLTEERL